MWRICATLYQEQPPGRWFVTDGWMPKRKARDRFVQEVTQAIRVESGIELNPVHIVLMVLANPHELLRRRNRSPEDQARLHAELEMGSALYPYSPFVVHPGQSPDALAHRFRRRIDRWAQRGWIDKSAR